MQHSTGYTTNHIKHQPKSKARRCPSMSKNELNDGQLTQQPQKAKVMIAAGRMLASWQCQQAVAILLAIAKAIQIQASLAATANFAYGYGKSTYERCNATIFSAWKGLKCVQMKIGRCMCWQKRATLLCISQNLETESLQAKSELSIEFSYCRHDQHL